MLIFFLSLKNGSKTYPVIASSYAIQDVIVLVKRKIMLLINIVVTVQGVHVGQAYRRTYSLRYKQLKRASCNWLIVLPSLSTAEQIPTQILCTPPCQSSLAAWDSQLPDTAPRLSCCQINFLPSHSMGLQVVLFPWHLRLHLTGFSVRLQE